MPTALFITSNVIGEYGEFPPVIVRGQNKAILIQNPETGYSEKELEPGERNKLRFLHYKREVERVNLNPDYIVIYAGNFPLELAKLADSDLEWEKIKFLSSKNEEDALDRAIGITNKKKYRHIECETGGAETMWAFLTHFLDYGSLT